jgi:KaiC/GvpD/RAD55 family RecA-like ATPase
MLKNCLTGLDELFAEGSDIPAGSVVLVTGIEGSLKSSFVFNLISNFLAGSNRHAVYATMEENEESYLRNMTGIGVKKMDNMHIFDYRDMRHEFKDVVPDMIKITEDMINFYTNKYPDLALFAFDSLNALYSVMPQENMRSIIYYFFSLLRDKGLTSFLILETSSRDKHSPIWIGDSMARPEFFLADGVIELGMIETNENVKRYIQIRKMRSANHSMRKYQLVVEKDGIHIFGSVY